MKGDRNIDDLKDMLIKRRQELLKRISLSVKNEISSSEFEGDEYDRAISAEDREMTFAMTSMERKELLAIDNALKKMSEGTYGICEECEKKITKKRLKILPFTKHCKDCQAEIELENIP